MLYTVFLVSSKSKSLVMRERSLRGKTAKVGRWRRVVDITILLGQVNNVDRWHFLFSNDRAPAHVP